MKLNTEFTIDGNVWVLMAKSNKLILLQDKNNNLFNIEVYTDQEGLYRAKRFKRVALDGRKKDKAYTLSENEMKLAIHLISYMKLGM